MQPKIDGIRVVIYRGEPFNRLGEPLSATLRAMFKGVDVALDGEWLTSGRSMRLCRAPAPRAWSSNDVSVYTKQRRASAETRDWLKRRFAWDLRVATMT